MGLIATIHPRNYGSLERLQKRAKERQGKNEDEVEDAPPATQVHFHTTSSLLDKIKYYFEETKSYIQVVVAEGTSGCGQLINNAEPT